MGDERLAGRRSGLDGATVTIHVTRDLVACGTTQHAQACPVALATLEAMRRAYGLTSVVCVTAEARRVIVSMGNGQHYRLVSAEGQAKVQAFIEAFDWGGIGHPFSATFTMETRDPWERR